MTTYYYPETIDQELHEQLLHDRKWMNGQERMRELTELARKAVEPEATP
jgi:hypothetical protein